MIIEIITGVVLLGIVTYLITMNQLQNNINKNILKSLEHATKHLEIQENINKRQENINQQNLNRFNKSDHQNLWIYDKLNTLVEHKIKQQ